jgi:hypothetical protein
MRYRIPAHLDDVIRPIMFDIQARTFKEID